MCKLNFKTLPIRLAKFTLIFVALLVPCVLLSPFVIGVIESNTNKDMVGIGSCRIDNTLAVLTGTDKGARLVSGIVLVDGKEYNHLWGESSNGNLIDVTCPHNVKRIIREKMNPFCLTIPVVASDTKTLKDVIAVNWNRAYLMAFIANKNLSRG